jgi:hypothetical protein
MPLLLHTQVDTTFYPPQDTIDPYPLSPYAILSPFEEVESIDAFAMARFEGQTRVYIRLSGKPDKTYEVEVSNSNLKFYFSEEESNFYAADFVIPSNLSAQVVSRGAAVKDTILSFNSTTGKREVLEVSKPMMERLSKWKSDFGNVNLITFLEDAQDIHIVEKLDFIQHHFLKDALLPTNYFNELPPADSEITGGGEGGCICSFVVRREEDIYPGTELDNGEIYPHYGTTGKIDEGDWEHWREWSFEGLPRFYQQFSQGNGNASRTNEGGSSYFRLEQLYACSNFLNNLPEGCDCEVPVHYYYKYTSTLDARAKIRSCFLCGDREAETKVDDYVFAFFTDNSDRYASLGGGAAASWAKDSKPQAKIAKLILPAASIALNLKGIAATKGLKLAFSIGKLTADVAKIVDILNDPVKNAKDTADYQILEVEGDTIINIYPNVKSEFVVVSFTVHAFDNKKRFFTWNRVLSSGYAQAIIQGGPLDNHEERPECCVPNVSQYAQASFTDRYSTANILDHINGNANILLGHSFPDVTNQIGVRWTPFPGCAVIVDERSSADPFQITVTPSYVLIEDAFIPPFNYAIYDLTGRLQNRGEASGNIIYLDHLNLAPGIYVLRVSNETAEQVVKFWKH